MVMRDERPRLLGSSAQLGGFSFPGSVFARPQ
jgi:hypothetical protein